MIYYVLWANNRIPHIRPIGMVVTSNSFDRVMRSKDIWDDFSYTLYFSSHSGASRDIRSEPHVMSLR